MYYICYLLHKCQLRNGILFGSSCSTAVECTTQNREVLSSNPVRHRAFFPLSSQWHVLDSGPSRMCNTAVFPIEFSLAVQLEAKRALYAWIDQKMDLS